MELSQASQQQAVMPPTMLPPGHPDMQANAYYPEPPNDVTGGLPITLDSLRDGPPGSKPFYPYSTLIRYAPARR
jgi:forkhead box protein J2/3